MQPHAPTINARGGDSIITLSELQLITAPHSALYGDFKNHILICVLYTIGI